MVLVISDEQDSSLGLGLVFARNAKNKNKRARPKPRPCTQTKTKSLGGNIIAEFTTSMAFYIEVMSEMGDPHG